MNLNNNNNNSFNSSSSNSVRRPRYNLKKMRRKDVKFNAFNKPSESCSNLGGEGSSRSNDHSDDVFKFKAFKDSLNESLVDALPNDISKLSVGETVGSKFGNVKTRSFEGVNMFRGGNVDSTELGRPMGNMNLGSGFVFGRNSKSDERLAGRVEAEEKTVLERMGKLKVSGDGNEDNVKSFVFGSKTSDGFSVRTERNREEGKEDLISDKMRNLKVGGGGEEFVFGKKVEPKVYEATSSTSFQPFVNVSFDTRPDKSVEFSFSSKVDNLRTPDAKGSLFSGVKSVPESRLKKNKGKVGKAGKARKPVISQTKVTEDYLFSQSERSSVEVPESFEAYSLMDTSPYRETLADSYSQAASVTSDDAASQMNDQNSVMSESYVNNPNVTTDEDLVNATQRLNVSDGDVRCEVSEAETFKSAMDNVEFSSDSFASALDSELSSTATSRSQEKTETPLFKFGAKLENISKENFTFGASTSSQGQVSPGTRHHKKKHRLKTGRDSYSPVSDAQSTYVSSSSSRLSPVNTQKGDMSPLSSKNMDSFKPVNEQDSNIGTFSTPSASIAAEEACEKWRLRGNQAYGNGDLAKAEDYYTQGINSVSQSEKSRGCLRALMLCYSNRAATRISLGRMKDALKDCLMAAAIDPNFLKVQVRAAHCYLAIGEVEKATFQYMKCLQSGSDICVDRKLLVEASEGLEKAQKVTERLKQYAELPRRTPDDTECALRVINEALQISSYSEQLLQTKADILITLRRYEQVIQMCEKTLSYAETDMPTSSSSWRSTLIVKSYFCLGRLEEAREFIKKQESSGQITERLGSMGLDSVIPLADRISELLSRKAAGNEAYKSGKFAEAVEHYSSALSCSVESRPFAAICFCNRAAAYRALSQIADAIADCSLAIALDPSYLKAISRRASLYEMIRDYGQAATDFRRLVSLLTSQMEERGILSDNSSGMNELRQTQLRLNNIEEESRKKIPLNMYLILGVESTAAASEVKKAYRKAALKHHPDKAALLVSRSDNGDDGLWKEIAENVHKDADRLFKMIGEAYAVLSNPSKRSEYDMDEEMRNEVNKYTRSSSGRMGSDAQSPVFARSGSRRWQDPWRPFVNSQFRGQDNTSSYRYSRNF